MSASIDLDVSALRDAIAGLESSFLEGELPPIVRANAEGMAENVKSEYPTLTGTLAARVVVEAGASPLRVKVRTKAPHAHLYEYGTVSRFTNRTGASRGEMFGRSGGGGRPVFVPAAVRWRRRLVEDVTRALRALRVPGFEGTPEVRES